MGRLHLTRITRTLATDSPAAAPEPERMPVPVPGGGLEPTAACPFHMVMDQLAQTAVMQQVLYLEGEVLPPDDLVDALDGWQQLHHLVRTQVCPATRQAPLTQADLAALVDTTVPRLLPASVPTELAASLCQQLIACATCPSAQQCPMSPPGVAE